MTKYKIFETNEFRKMLERISDDQKAFVVRKLREYVYALLREEPHYGNNIKKLVNYDPEIWRYRLGKFRLFYVINESEKIIYLISIDLRKDAY